MNTETFDARVTAEVSADLWAYQPEHSCDLCGKVSLDGRPHLSCLRSAVRAVLTGRDLAGVLGVTAGLPTGGEV